MIGEGPDCPRQLYGGDLDGIIAHLDHIASLGVGTLYLTPLFPAESNHRYNASTFDRIDPLLGGDAAFARLADAAHARGMRLMGDLTTNHCGDTHEWFQAALADPNSPEAAFFFFERPPGQVRRVVGPAAHADLRPPLPRAAPPALRRPGLGGRPVARPARRWTPGASTWPT